MITTPTIPFVSTMNESDENVWLQALSKLMPDETILPLRMLNDQARQLVDIAIVANPNPEELQTLPNLVWVHSVWAGVEKILQSPVTHNFSIVRLVDPKLSQTMAEAVLAWTLYLHRDMPEYAAQQAKAVWQPLPYISASERTVGVLGLGELGKEAALLLAKLGFNVIAWSRSQKTIDQIETFSTSGGLDRVLGRSDILICLLPHTPATENLLSFENLSKLKPGAKLINFARGRIIDDEALLYDLNRGHIQHAVLDVFAYEPLPVSHTFWTHPKVTVLPHISAPTTVQSASEIVAQNVRNYRHLRVLPDTVNTQLGY